MHIHIKCVRISISCWFMYAHIYTYTVISSPGLVCRRPSGRIRHQKRLLFGDKEILKRNFMSNGGGGAPRSLTASWNHMDFIFGIYKHIYIYIYIYMGYIRSGADSLLFTMVNFKSCYSAAEGWRRHARSPQPVNKKTDPPTTSSGPRRSTPTPPDPHNRNPTVAGLSGKKKLD